MGLVRRVLSSYLLVLGVGAGASYSVGYLTGATTLITPLDTGDRLLKSPLLRRLNQHGNPVMSDLCVVRIPLSRIRADLRSDEGKLATEFCRAVWSGWAHAPQRMILAQKYQGSETQDQLWTQNELKSSSYAVGECFVDHFEVVERSNTEVVVRAGGSPRFQAPRELDGLLVTRATIDRRAGVAEVGLGTVFFKGDHKTTDGSKPVPYPVELLHQLYARALVFSGSQGLMEQ